MEIDPEDIPENHLAGWWRWVNGAFVFDQALYDELHNPSEPPNYEALLAQADVTILDLTEQLIIAQEGLT